MRASRAPIAVAVVVLVALPSLAQPKPRCQLSEAGLPEFKEAHRLCQATTDSRIRCSHFLNELVSAEELSFDQALALAFGRATAARLDGVDSEIAEANLAGRQLLKPFVDAAPDDPMLLRAYAIFHLDEIDLYAELLGRVLALEPTCSAAAFWLAIMGASDDEAHNRQAAAYLNHGYEHSSGMWKLLFAFLKYQFLSHSAPEAEAFRTQVAADAGSLHVLADGDLAPELYWALLRQVEMLDPIFSPLVLGPWPVGFGNDDESNRPTDLTVDYQHSPGTWELLVAFWKYRLLQRDQPEQAEAYRAQVAADMESRHMPLDVENRGESLKVLCNGSALKLRLQARCVDAVEKLAAGDRLANVPLGADVLQAIVSLNAAAEEGDLGDDGAMRRRHWRQLLEAEPARYRSAQFYVVYSQVLRRTTGVEAEVEALRRALDLDPRSGEIGLYLTGALKRAGRPAREIKDVYRHVMANADGRTVKERKPADYYAARAVQLMRELDSEENPPAANQEARPPHY